MFSELLIVMFAYDHAEYSTGELLESLFLSYNIIIHFPITILNTIIIFKEFLLEWVQASERRDGHDSDVALGILDLVAVFNDTLYFLNPYNWIIFFLHNF